MNKFVKGAKNLAFALSFVTVAACGNVKKADLEAALKGFEEKVDGKLKGIADNGAVDEGQGYVRKNDIKDFVKSEVLDSKIDGLEKKVVSLDVWKKNFVNNPVDFIKNFGRDFVLPEKYFDGYKVVISDLADGGVCKYGVEKGEDVLIKSKGIAATLTSEDLDVLLYCVLNGASVDWGKEMVFTKGGASDGVVFGGGKFDVGDKDQMISLSVLLELGLKAEKEYKNLGFGTWIVNNNKIGGKALPDRVENKMFADVLNKYKQGCCEFVSSGNKVKLKANMGWTSDGGSAVVDTDVEISQS